MKVEDVQFLTGQIKRVETGVVQFGGDWPGVFIRGDNAFGYLAQLEKAIEIVGDQINEGEFFERMALKTLMDLKELLESSNTQHIEGYYQFGPSKVRGVDAKAIRRQAEEEVAQERRRERVDAIKTELRNKKPFWHRVFPWKITRR